jgi:DNA mismatch endonuclease (patch repair protein)
MGRKRRDPEQVSFNMSRVKRSDSLIEQFFYEALREYKLRPTVQPKMFGHPDFAFKKHKIVIFCDSHFWHGYKWSVKKAEIKNNKRFWVEKIETNIARDRAVNRMLRRQGWAVFRFWEHDIKSYPLRCAEKIRIAIEQRKSASHVLNCN